jgi:hypothetical protein
MEKCGETNVASNELLSSEGCPSSEIKKQFHETKIQSMERETNTDPIDIINQNDTYVGMLSTDKSLDVTNYKCSNIEIKTQDQKIPYRYPNHKIHCITQCTN